jgi:hypothetical protein
VENLIIYKMKQLPDFRMQDYRVLYGNDVRGHVMAAQKSFLLLMHSLGERNICSLSLRYFYDPEDIPGKRLSIYLIIRNESGMSADKIRQIIENSPIAPFYSFTDKNAVLSECKSMDIDKDILDPSSFKYAIEGIKEEATYQPMFKGKSELNTDPQIRNSPFQVVPYYIIHPIEPIEDNDMTFIDKQFLAYNKRMLVEIIIKPTKLTTNETLAVSRIIGELENITSSSSVSISTSTTSIEPVDKDLLADLSQEKLEEMQEMLMSEKCFEFALRVFGDDEDYTMAMADNLFLAGNKNGRYRLFSNKSNSEKHRLVCKASLECTPSSSIMWDEFWNHVPEGFDVFHFIGRLSRVATLDEVSPYFRLPVLGTEPLMTIPTTNEFEIKRDENGELPPVITLGHETLKPIRPAMVEIEQLCKHQFDAGVPGSGKTKSNFNKLFQLHCAGVPFMVIEPSKTEYRLLKRLAFMDSSELKNLGVDPSMIEVAQSLGRELRVYTVGNELVSPLRFNPFEFPEGIGLYEHIANIEACFKGALPINFGSLPALLGEAIEEIYKDCGWNAYDSADGSKPFPTMQMLYDKISEIFNTKDYSADVKGDLKTAIEVRIGSLLRRSIGRIFNTNVSCPNTEDLMTKPVILELDCLNEEQANLITMFMLSRVSEYVRATRSSGSRLSHVIVLEEAHNIIGKVDNQGGEDTANPKVEATKYISRFLAEMRALGEGLIIVDQLPSAVAPEVIKNTNVKLVHRLVSADDREDIGMTMLMDGIQMEDLARLLPGESYLYQEGMTRAVRINELYIPKTFPVLDKAPPDNRELTRMLNSDTWWFEGLFLEIIQITKGLEKLSLDINQSVSLMMKKSIRLQKEGTENREANTLWNIFMQREVKFNEQYKNLNDNTLFFFKLMARRYPEGIGRVEKSFRPLLTKAQKMVMHAFGKFDVLGSCIKKAHITAKG